MDILFLIISIVSAVLAYKLTLNVYMYYIKWKTLSRIPGPPAVPVLGTLVLRKAVTDEEHLWWHLTFGNIYKDGIYIYWIGCTPIVSLYDPNLIQVILSSNVYIEKPYQKMFLHEWLGNGLITSSGEEWRKDRKLLVPTFHFDILVQFAVIMSERTELLVKRLEEKITENPQQAINVIPYIADTSMEIILETAMGITSYKKISDYTKAANKYLSLLFTRIYYWIYNATPAVIHALLPAARQSKLAVDYMHKVAYELIQTRKLARNTQNGKIECKQNEYDVSDKPRRKAFLDLLLDLKDNGHALSDDKVRSHVDTFLFAGYDTTKTSICWALFCIGNYLNCQEKIHEELEEVFKDSQKPATIDEISKLKYLARVIKETRRLYSTVPHIFRKVSHEIKIGDYVIPANTRIVISIILLHRNPAFWPDPLKFDPDRFLPENTKQMHPYAYVPFSAGPRNCIGQKFAVLEEKIVLTAILRKWKIKCVETPEEMTAKSNVVLKPSCGIHLHFIPKK